MVSQATWTCVFTKNLRANSNGIGETSHVEIVDENIQILSINNKKQKEIELFPVSDPQGITGSYSLYLLPHSLRGACCCTAG